MSLLPAWSPARVAFMMHVEGEAQGAAESRKPLLFCRIWQRARGIRNRRPPTPPTFPKIGRHRRPCRTPRPPTGFETVGPSPDRAARLAANSAPYPPVGRIRRPLFLTPRDS
jgi:hypothetical protein